MTPDVLINGTGVQASATANTGQRFGISRVIDIAAPVVEQNDVHMLRAVRIAILGGTTDQVYIAGQALPGSTTCKQLDQRGKILNRFDYFFDANNGDMDLWQRRAHPRIAFV